MWQFGIRTSCDRANCHISHFSDSDKCGIWQFGLRTAEKSICGSSTGHKAGPVTYVAR